MARSRSRSPRRQSPLRDRRDDRGADRYNRDRDNHRGRGSDRQRDRRDDRYPDRTHRRRPSRSRSPPRRPSRSTSPNRDRRDRDRDRQRQQVVPFGERSLREEKQQEKTPAEIAEEQRQHKLAQIAALLDKLNTTQQQPLSTADTTEQKEQTAAAVVEEGKEAEESEEAVEAQLMSLMGLPVKGFDSTKGKEVKDGNVSGVKVATQRKFRQVMKNNKAAAFGRPAEAAAG